MLSRYQSIFCAHKSMRIIPKMTPAFYIHVPSHTPRDTASHLLEIYMFFHLIIFGSLQMVSYQKLDFHHSFSSETGVCHEQNAWDPMWWPEQKFQSSNQWPVKYQKIFSWNERNRSPGPKNYDTEIKNRNVECLSPEHWAEQQNRDKRLWPAFTFLERLEKIPVDDWHSIAM